jgi:cytochrome oxidase Cu insertion factor (SCO1/SenC/PrrC family)
MDLINAVEYCRKNDPELFVEDGVYLPSWTKFAMNPIKAKGFWNRMLQAVFLGEHSFDELNIEYQIGGLVDSRVAMMFLPGSITNKNLGVACELAQKALPSFSIIPVYGEVTSNYDCERDVKEKIEKAKRAGKGVLILSARMAQRSFSVGDITEMYLAYDSGENGATIQKISRTLTPKKAGKIGRIVSLSFDPNRDDKFDSLLIETSINYKSTRGLKSAKQAIKEVLKTVDLFRCTEDGRVKINSDDYLEQAIERNSIARVTGKVSNLDVLNPAELAALAKGNIEAYRQAKKESAQKGKTGAKKNVDKKNVTSLLAKILAQARSVIAGIVENVDYILLGTDDEHVIDALNKIIKSGKMNENFSNMFGIDAELVLDLFVRGVINEDFVELQMNRTI